MSRTDHLQRLDALLDKALTNAEEGWMEQAERTGASAIALTVKYLAEARQAVLASMKDEYDWTPQVVEPGEAEGAES